MANVEPHVEVYNKTKPKTVSYGEAGKIALIGAFPSSTFNLGVFDDLESAQNAVIGDNYKLPGDTSIENAGKTEVTLENSGVAFFCIEQCFIKNSATQGPEDILIVNTNHGKETLATTVTNADIAAACTLLAEEEFDILTIADNLSLVVTTLVTGENNTSSEVTTLNPVWTTLKTFYDSQFFSQKPFGIITGIDFTNATEALLIKFKALWQYGGFFKAVSTPVKKSGDASSLSIAESGAWHAAFTAGRAVNLSETAKLYPGITGENSKEKFPVKPNEEVTWKKLLDNGFHTTRYENRREQTIECTSNITPADYDMKIERVRNYILKRITAKQFLGDDNDELTRERFDSLFRVEKGNAIRSKFVVDMGYEFVKADTETCKAKVWMAISDVLRVVILENTVEITGYEGE